MGYFSHDENASRDEKILLLRAKHGAAGYGVYFMILEQLFRSENYQFPADYKALSIALGEKKNLIRSVVENFGLFQFTENGDYFFSQGFRARMEIKDSATKLKSDAGKKGMEKRWGKNKFSEEKTKVFSEKNKISDSGVEQKTCEKSPAKPQYSSRNTQNSLEKCYNTVNNTVNNDVITIKLNKIKENNNIPQPPQNLQKRLRAEASAEASANSQKIDLFAICDKKLCELSLESDSEPNLSSESSETRCTFSSSRLSDEIRPETHIELETPQIAQKPSQIQFSPFTVFSTEIQSRMENFIENFNKIDFVIKSNFIPSGDSQQKLVDYFSCTNKETDEILLTALNSAEFLRSRCKKNKFCTLRWVIAHIDEIIGGKYNTVNNTVITKGKPKLFNQSTYSGDFT